MWNVLKLYLDVYYYTARPAHCQETISSHSLDDLFEKENQ